MSVSSFLAASSRRGEVLRGFDASVGQVEERYVGGHCFPLVMIAASLLALRRRIALGRCRQHSTPQARIDRPVDKRRASHPLPLPRFLPKVRARCASHAARVVDCGPKPRGRPQRISNSSGKASTAGMRGGRKNRQLLQIFTGRSSVRRTSARRTSARRTSWRRTSQRRTSAGHPSTGRTSIRRTSAGRTSARRAPGFDFLGYGFRPRSVKGPASQRMLCGYTPGVSKPALNAMRSKIRSMTLRKRQRR